MLLIIDPFLFYALFQRSWRSLFLIVFDFVYPSLSTLQFGFVNGRSCLQQLLTTLSAIYNNSINHQQSDLIFLDFKKAFDSVSHDELLWNLGIT